ncbi:hypothetical protein LUW76_23485 [Actinomadura madurae]|uniref:ribonuclease D n=1 Tax=Actinomadura madurae TaxID=1993 RepID=UPI0020271EEE|nr:hypothetical protein [Actinomadura madurae]URM97075.1 hypothetical protein LUW76_23485 [Actinomadura madurae]
MQVTIFQDDISPEIAALLTRQDVVAWDIETSGLEWRRESIGTCQLYTEATGAIVVQIGSGVPVYLSEVLTCPRVVKLFHHAMFDLRFMANAWGVRPVNISCTKVAAKLLWPTEASEWHSLRGLLHNRLGVTISKAQRVSDWMAEDLTLAQLEYAIGDVVHLLELHKVLVKDMQERDILHLYQKCIEFLPSRVALEVGGWPDVFTY